MSRRGHNRERAVKALLEDDGWLVVRAAGSFGFFDLVALKVGFPPRVVEVKSTVGGPYSHFLPADRRAMADAARRAGAEAWLLWWPPRAKPKWIHSDDWPTARAAA